MTSASKPEIIYVAIDIDPNKGSEAGKGWWWASALSPYFKLHVVTHRRSLDACRNETLPTTDYWTFHPTKMTVETWKFPTGYLQYHRLLQEMHASCRDLIRRFPIHGLCHVALGSFRMLPRYDRLGLPYVLGPLGGGECSPLALLQGRPAPFSDKVKELVRPVINNSFALVPGLRSCLAGAAMVLTTSAETETVVRRMGARRTAPVFPDAYTNPIDVEARSRLRAAQADSIRERIRLIWQGRPLWWKGPDFALEVLRVARNQGLKIDLTMVSSWDTDFGRTVQALAQKKGVAAHVDFVGGMTRNPFLEMMESHHGMLAPSLHDSGGIPLVEAQALGLPCFSFGLGGHKLAACPEAGVNETPPRREAFVERTVACLARWQQDPSVWLEESEKAIRFATQFTIAGLSRDVERLIVPALAAK